MSSTLSYEAIYDEEEQIIKNVIIEFDKEYITASYHFLDGYMDENYGSQNRFQI